VTVQTQRHHAKSVCLYDCVIKQELYSNLLQIEHRQQPVVKYVAFNVLPHIETANNIPWKLESLWKRGLPSNITLKNTTETGSKTVELTRLTTRETKTNIWTGYPRQVLGINKQRTPKHNQDTKNMHDNDTALVRNL